MHTIQDISKGKKQKTLFVRLSRFYQMLGEIELTRTYVMG